MGVYYTSNFRGMSLMSVVECPGAVIEMRRFCNTRVSLTFDRW